MASSTSHERLEVEPIDESSILFADDDHYTSDTVCLVTGGGSGIGRATALAMAANGVTAVATDIDADGLAEVADTAADLDLDGAVETVAGDLANDADIEAIVETAASHGTVRYLANIAGLQHIDAIEDFPMEKYDQMHDVMLRAPLALSKRVIPHIRGTDDGVGAIGNMASVHGHYVTSDKVAYNVSKFGLRGLTQSIAAEGGDGLRGFSISTGYVKTPLVVDQIPDTAEQRGISVDEVIDDVMLGQARIKEMMDPIDVANLFVFGFSRHANHLNGGDLLFDGGMTKTYE
ncbi:D-beta-hydroxybutyrate dehydrogenase [Haloarcula marismortui ATCC 43049]|uniref:D-beta-hydroxybutyrate dehydrogenase n=1 Tax=Haloarcula marismortui (strain ATCC 43049 / DSM 3752 / JCM 8966 / VKM B-1809) TaxID=272569 RepID=Q5V499_HALMA|nr:SDR family oxidoreductase [Haloarcula marismortui]AAV45653.1 D-beta-hydroxybutyrate dehydrogenase [Haloarcula marismortui ATCC 43049]QCP90435.1 SDR family oxidoreductase [Haloarcula marismortui ATCC 43049]